MPLSSVWTVLAFWPSDHCCGSSQWSTTARLKRFKVLRLNSKSNTLHTQWTEMILICKPSNPIFVEYFGREKYYFWNRQGSSIKIQSLPEHIRPLIDWRIEQRQFSTRIPLWHIISVGFRGFTRWSRNIFRMEVRRAYLIFCWPLVSRENLWRHSSGSCHWAVEEQFLPNLPVPVHRMEIFTIRQLNLTGNCWNCRYEAMFR